MNIVDLPSDFYSSRNGEPVRYIVRHTTEGTDSRGWLTKTGGVSAHYLVRGTVVYRLVGEELAAWHAGRIVGIPTTPLYTGTWEDIYENGVWLGGGWTMNPNRESIGIEMEGYAAGPIDPDALAAVVALIRDIRTRHDVPCVDHRDISPGDRTDPGIWAAAIDAALLEDDMASLGPEDKEYIDAKFTELYAALAASQRRQMRGHDPFTAGEAEPIAPGEQLYPSNAK